VQSQCIFPLLPFFLECRKMNRKRNSVGFYSFSLFIPPSRVWAARSPSQRDLDKFPLRSRRNHREFSLANLFFSSYFPLYFMEIIPLTPIWPFLPTIFLFFLSLLQIDLLCFLLPILANFLLSPGVLEYVLSARSLARFLMPRSEVFSKRVPDPSYSLLHSPEVPRPLFLRCILSLAWQYSDATRPGGQFCSFSSVQRYFTVFSPFLPPFSCGR